jgi:hypothetical protein
VHELREASPVKQVPVSMPRRPFGAGEMVLEGLSRSIGFAVRIEARHNPSKLAPVGTFRIRIEHAHMGDRMLLIVRGKRGMGVLDRRRED